MISGNLQHFGWIRMGLDVEQWGKLEMVSGTSLKITH